ncbi:hypothetical protein [Pinibacter soli]|uniref:Uncharacterized protein n=1 Tax=Pinibacter soli TaxID=3044211 RepID=A0ABT6R7U3_9BACT|nr:hypothetical protein [Pinibacter soli]MDI3318634.1 hypothetical protein [Pinibacter soli]
MKKIFKRIHKLSAAIAKSKVKSGDYDFALNCIESLAFKAYNYNYLEKFSDDHIENILKDISNILLQPVVATNKDSNKVVFYDSFAYDLRGFTQQYLYALWDLGYEILFIRSNNNGLDNSKDILSEIEKHPNTRLLIVNSANGHLKNLQLLYKEVKDFNPSKIFLHISPWDVMALLLFIQFPNITKYQIDFTDHAFWLGKCITDKLLTFRDFGADVAFKYRKIQQDKIFKIQPYPLIKNMVFNGLPVERSPDKVIGFSGGHSYKIIDEKNTFLNLIKTLLGKHANFVFLFACVGDDTRIKDFICQNNLSDRFILLGNRPDIYQVFCNIDLYINTYPYGGGNMILYAAAANKPILSLYDEKLLHTHLHNIIDISKDDAYGFENENEFLKGATKLIVDINAKDRYSKKLSFAISNRQNFTREIERLLNDDLQSAKVNTSFSMDVNYLFETHLSFNKIKPADLYKSARGFGYVNIAKTNKRILFGVLYHDFKFKAKNALKTLLGSRFLRVGNNRAG